MSRLPQILSKLTVAAATLLTACESTTTNVAPVASVTVEPSQASLVAGETAQLRATMRDQAGNLLNGRTATWSSSVPSVATVNANGLVQAVGSGTTTITATAEGRSGSAQIVSQGRATIQLGEDEIDFQATRGETDPAPRQVGITNAGEAPLVNLSVSTTYLDGGEDGWLATSLLSTTAPTSLGLAASLGGLQSGTYRARVDATSVVAGNSPQSIAVTFTVLEPPPILVLSTETVPLDAPETSVTPVIALVDLTNGGGSTLDGLEATITYSPGQPVGWLTAAFDQPVAPTRVRLGATAGSLPLGMYSADVIISAPAATNSPVTVTVTFTVVPRAASFPGA